MTPLVLSAVASPHPARPVAPGETAYEFVPRVNRLVGFNRPDTTTGGRPRRGAVAFGGEGIEVVGRAAPGTATLGGPGWRGGLDPATS